MLKPQTILNRLYDKLQAAAQDRRVDDLRIGLSYVGVRLDNGSAGLAAVLPDASPRGCTVLKEAGTFAGASASELLQYLVSGRHALHRAMAVACANALTVAPDNDHEDREATSLFNLQPGEKVAMVGLFAPLVERIRKTGASLTIIEKNPERLNVLAPEDKSAALKACDVAIITATTLLNATFEETIHLLGAPRLVALMGPSTPLAPDIFSDTAVTHLGGAVVADAARALQVISEGGGTPALRPSLRFVNLIVER
ncbi:MAG TPA: DUF364 domain-containing protein [Smithellaceae bacterium]|nr:DUF364 domain-containing protein [Smithellaceae bacterium]